MRPLIQRLLIGVSALFIVGFLVLATLRVSYPYEIKPTEGATISHVIQLMDHGTVYVPPSIEFTPFFYPPASYYWYASIFSLLGVGFSSARFASLLATMIASIAVGYTVYRRSSKNFPLAFIAIGLFLASFGKSGYFLDAVRVDSILTMWLALAVTVLLTGRSDRSAVVASLCFAAALFTKQQALLFFPVLLFAAWSTSRKSALLFSFGIILLTVAAITYFQVTSDGWFWRYVWIEPQAKTSMYSWARTFVALRYQLFWGSPLVFAAILLFKKKFTKENSVLIVLYLSSLLVGAFGIGNIGGDKNVLLPCALCTAITAPLLFCSIKELGAPFINRWSPLLLLLNFGALLYNPFDSGVNIPTSHSQKRQEALLDTLRKAKGNIYFLSHAYTLTLAGHKDWAESSSLQDAALVNDSIGKRIGKEWEDRLRQHFFAIIITDAKTEIPYYRLAKVQPSGFMAIPTGDRNQYFYEPEANNK